MRQLLTCVLVCACCAGLSAQAEPASPALAGPEGIVVPAATVSSQPSAASVPPASTQARRRPSMVGYIDEASVQSQFRLRFDAAFHNDFPDRAEFFYAKCGCYKGLANAIPPAFDPTAPGPGEGVPTTLNFQQLYLDAEYAPLRRVSVFGELPVRWLQPQGFKPVPPFPAFPNEGGLGDVRAGVKVAAVASETATLTLQLRAYFPSGDAAKGLGTHHGTLEPALLYYQQLTGRLAVESQLGAWHPLSGSIGVPTAGGGNFWGDVIFYGIGPSYEVYRSSEVRVAPVVELVGWSVRGGFLTQPGGPVAGAAASASGTNIVNLKIGGRVVFRDRNSVYVGYGRALTTATWYDDIVRVEYRLGF